MREKLIELLEKLEKEGALVTMGNGYVANLMIANGVTLATDNNVGKWISVKERLPEDNERVLVYHDDGVIRFGINKDGFADVVSSLYLHNNHRTCFSKVTHWMPLPQPTKGE
jgi:hypothetical protein